MPSAPSIPPPPVGSIIDNGAIEFVDILGYGGYGVVFRAVDTATRTHQYAVKCLTHAQAPRQRNLHMREINLHRIASAHPSVVSLHRVIEDQTFTYIILDYFPEGDLFTQILHHRTYLGHDNLIKKVFLQLLDAVEHCHNLGIYHRDLKPENVLCKTDGLHVAITDFGLATTDKLSTEFRTGSVYHMSPECHGPDKQHPAFAIASKGGYSPAANDIWSLGIILLNLATGRNPWKSATASDPTFWAYLHDRAHFLPTVLPISPELNAILVRTLDPIWTTRITLRELRAEIRRLPSVYAHDVVFEHSMARCAWEAALEPESPEESMVEAVTPPEVPKPAVAEVPAKPTLKVQTEEPVSVWSADTPSHLDTPMEYTAVTSTVEDASFLELIENAAHSVKNSPVVATASTWSAHSSAPGQWRAAHRSSTPSPVSPTMPTWIHQADSGSTVNSSDSAPSLPSTPKGQDMQLAANPLAMLHIDTGMTHNEAGPDSALYSTSSFFDAGMHTAVDFADDERSAGAVAAPWAKMFYGVEDVKANSPLVTNGFTSADVPMHAVIDSDEDLGPCSPIAFRSGPRASWDSFASIGHDADIEDTTLSYIPITPIAPASAPANTTAFYPFGSASRPFFAPRTSGASSSSDVSASGYVSVSGYSGSVSRTPEGGKTRQGRGRRSSGRFNPLKFALRSLSPRRTREATAPSSSASSARGPQVAATVSVEFGMSNVVARVQRQQRPVAVRKPTTTGKFGGWLGGRLFGAAACAS